MVGTPLVASSACYPTDIEKEAATTAAKGGSSGGEGGVAAGGSDGSVPQAEGAGGDGGGQGEGGGGSGVDGAAAAEEAAAVAKVDDIKLEVRLVERDLQVCQAGALGEFVGGGGEKCERVCECGFLS